MRLQKTTTALLGFAFAFALGCSDGSATHPAKATDSKGPDPISSAGATPGSNTGSENSPNHGTTDNTTNNPAAAASDAGTNAGTSVAGETGRDAMQGATGGNGAAMHRRRTAGQQGTSQGNGDQTGQQR